MWEISDDHGQPEIICHMVPKCQFCDTPMEVWQIKRLHFDIVHGSGDKLGHAMDVILHCPNCHLECVFGVALSKSEYAKVIATEFIN